MAALKLMLLGIFSSFVYFPPSPGWVCYGQLNSTKQICFDILLARLSSFPSNRLVKKEKKRRKKSTVSNLSVPELKVVFVETVLANSTWTLLLRGENQRKKMVTYLYVTYRNCIYNTEVL